MSKILSGDWKPVLATVAPAWKLWECFIKFCARLVSEGQSSASLPERWAPCWLFHTYRVVPAVAMTMEFCLHGHLQLFSFPTWYLLQNLHPSLETQHMHQLILRWRWLQILYKGVEFILSSSVTTFKRYYRSFYLKIEDSNPKGWLPFSPQDWFSEVRDLKRVWSK